MVYTLDYCVRTALADRGESDLDKYQQFFNFAIASYRRLNLAGLLPTVKSVMLEVDPNTHTAELPDDYVSFIKIGFCKNGHVVNLDYDEDLCTQAQLGLNPNDDCDSCAVNIESDLNAIASDCTDGLGAWWYFPYYFNDAWYGGLYGYGSARYRGGYKIVGNQICFASNVTAERVLMEYKSNGIDGANTIIPEGAIDVIVSHIHLKAVTFDKNRNTRLDIVPYQQNYNMAVRAFRARHCALSAHDWKLAYLSSFSQSVKR